MNMYCVTTCVQRLKKGGRKACALFPSRHGDTASLVGYIHRLEAIASSKEIYKTLLLNAARGFAFYNVVRQHVVFDKLLRLYVFAFREYPSLQEKQ